MYILRIQAAYASMPTHAGGCSRSIQAELRARTDLVTSLHSPTEDSAKSIKSAAVLLGVQLGNVHKQGTSGVARLDVLNNLSILRASVQSLNLQKVSDSQVRLARSLSCIDDHKT